MSPETTNLEVSKASEAAKSVALPEVAPFRANFETNGGAGGASPYGAELSTGASPDASRLSTLEVVLGVAAVVGWLLFFAGGTIVSTAELRAMVEKGTFQSPLQAVWAWWGVVTCYTITNAAFLASLAAVAGQFSNRSRESELRSAGTKALLPPHIRDVMACYSAAAMRGFVIYLLVISGLLLVTTEAIASPDQNQYVRLAATISVISFIAGYDSQVFKQALDRIVALVSQTDVRKPRPDH